MSTDVTKLNLKNALNEKVKYLEEYYAVDVPEYPGWTFLLSPVIRAYGICPYLNVKDHDSKKKRVEWLQSKADGGKLYQETVVKLLDQQWMADLENDITMIRQELRDHVNRTISSLNDQTMKESSYTMASNEDVTSQYSYSGDDLPVIIDHDDLIENIRKRKEAKSQNKKVKETWNQTLRTLNYLYIKRGVDFSKYIHAVYGWVVRYKPPGITGEDELDSRFESLYERYNSTVSKLNNFRYELEKEKEDAEQQLATLISQNFQLKQVGRYWKKWSSLTDEKKEERIKSYCDWFAREQNKPMSMADDLTTFIISKLESKELRIMDLKWDSQKGVITHINVTVGEDENGVPVFELGKRAPRILKNTRKTSKKKREELFKTDEEKLLLQRINRLLLFELIKGQTLNKDLTLKSVMRNLRTRAIPENAIYDYISNKYEEMLDVIKETDITDDITDMINDTKLSENTV